MCGSFTVFSGKWFEGRHEADLNWGATPDSFRVRRIAAWQYSSRTARISSRMTQKRSIFEEVATAKPSTPVIVQAGIIDRNAGTARRTLRVWLIILFALVTLTLITGGLTRLTDAGLSITEWRPVTGALPPMNSDAWEMEFGKYRMTAEYRQQNRGMDLSEFKVIYWWEWGHRQLGRVIGLVWAGGMIFFWATRRIPAGWTGRLLFLGVLGGLQGGLGWWMVTSGFIGSAVDVASYRLAMHLGMAFLILAFISWFVFDLSRPAAEIMQSRRNRETGLGSYTAMLVCAVFLQILLGGLVAGIDAGRNYNDWPFMAGGLFPPEMWQIQPWWRNLFENDGTVQFMHRFWGYVIVAIGIGVWLAGRGSGHRRTRRVTAWIIAFLLAQVALGILTVISSAPWHFAIVHQVAAVVLWVAVLLALHQVRYPVSQSVREYG